MAVIVWTRQSYWPLEYFWPLWLLQLCEIQRQNVWETQMFKWLWKGLIFDAAKLPAPGSHTVLAKPIKHWSLSNILCPSCSLRTIWEHYWNTLVALFNALLIKIYWMLCVKMLNTWKELLKYRIKAALPWWSSTGLWLALVLHRWFSTERWQKKQNYPLSVIERFWVKKNLFSRDFL